MKVLLTVFLAALMGNSNIKTYDLTITIPNIKNTSGGVHVSVYSSKNKASFTKIGQEFKVLDFKAEGATGKYIIKNLPEGEYAIAIYHDENGDKKCNTNMIGIPKEGYGFTRLDKIWSLPKFDDCKVLLNKNLSVPINLIY
jgi:uncharacterized protein (DUF2141 family)